MKIAEQIPLVRLRNNEIVEGSFFLGCGSMGGASYYIYYVKLDDGGIALRKIGTSRTLVYEEKRMDGVYEVWERRLKPGKWIWAINVTDDSETRHKFRIPEGAIKREFILS